MLKLIATGLVAASVLVGSPASAQASSLVDRADRHGDVAVEGSTDGIDPAIVSSVDLRHVTMTRQPHGVRVVIRLKEVLPTRGRWVQEVGFSVAPRSWAGPGWFFAAFATPQHLGGAAAIFVEVSDEEDEPDPDDTEVFCRVDAAKGAKVVRLLIPDRCLPNDPGQLIVSTALHDKRGETPSLAHDELTVGGLVDLRPGR